MDKVFVVLAQATSGVAALVINVVLAYVLDGSSLGEFFYYRAAAQAATSLLTAPLSMWLTRSWMGDPGRVRAIKKMWLGLAVLLVVSGALLLALPRWIIGVTTVLCGVQIAGSLVTCSWNADGKLRFFAIGTVAQPVIRLVVLPLAIIVFNIRNPGYLMIVSVLIDAALLAYIYTLDVVRVRSVIGSGLEFHNFPEMFRQLSDGKSLIGYMTLAAIVYMGYQFLDKLMARELLGYEGVASLTLLMQWSYLLLAMALQPFIALVYPRVLQDKADGGRSLLGRYARFFLAVTATAVIVAWLLEGPLLRVAPPAYEQAVRLLWVGMLAGGLFMVGQVLSIWFWRSGNEHLHLVTIVSAAVSGVAGMWYFGRNSGVPGIMVGHVLFSLVFSGISAVYALWSRQGPRVESMS